MKSNKTYTYLANHGPSTPSELQINGGVSSALKQDGFRKFRISGGPGDIDVSPGRNQIIVYYLDGKHTPKAVIEKWRAENESTVAKASSWSLHQTISRNYPDFQAASREVFGPFDLEYENENPGVTEDPCPFCGREDFDQWPRHAPECPEL